MDNSAISCERLITGLCPAFSKTGTGVNAEIGAGVDQEAHLCKPIRHTEVTELLQLLAATSDCLPRFHAATYRARCISLHALKRRWYRQMSGTGDRPAERDGHLACRRVCEGERRREGLAVSAATCRASSSIRVIKVWISASDEATRATQGGGVTSAILSASWATSSKTTCACVAMMA